jgi:hypothetical protein
MADQRTDADRTLAAEILAEADDAEVAKRVFTYYRDAERAARTPRGTLYLHIGVLCGLVLKRAREES